MPLISVTYDNPTAAMDAQLEQAARAVGVRTAEVLTFGYVDARVAQNSAARLRATLDFFGHKGRVSILRDARYSLIDDSLRRAH